MALTAQTDAFTTFAFVQSVTFKNRTIDNGVPAPQKADFAAILQGVQGSVVEGGTPSPSGVFNNSVPSKDNVKA